MTADDELRDQMRRADPAASLEPLSESEVSSILNRAMDDSGAHRRPPLKPVVALVGLASAAVVALIVGLGGGGSQPIVERVSAGPAVAAKCLPPTADGLREADVAVEGKVRGISNGIVTLDISRVWAGPKADVLEVQQSGGASETTLFEVGQTYLVAAQDGEVRDCGYTGAVSPELRSLFDQAF